LCSPTRRGTISISTLHTSARLNSSACGRVPRSSSSASERSMGSAMPRACTAQPPCPRRGQADDHTVARWAHAVGRSVGPLPVALYRRATTRTYNTVLPSAPGEAQLRLMDWRTPPVPGQSVSRCTSDRPRRSPPATACRRDGPAARSERDGMPGDRFRLGEWVDAAAMSRGRFGLRAPETSGGLEGTGIHSVGPKRAEARASCLRARSFTRAASSLLIDIWTAC